MQERDLISDISWCMEFYPHESAEIYRDDYNSYPPTIHEWQRVIISRHNFSLTYPLTPHGEDTFAVVYEMESKIITLLDLLIIIYEFYQGPLSEKDKTRFIMRGYLSPHLDSFDKNLDLLMNRNYFVRLVEVAPYVYKIYTE